MADSNLLVLAKEFSKLRSEVKNVLALPVGPEGKQGEKGAPGKDGKDGLNGRDGIGMQGPAGAPGRDGRDGQDGKDGVDGQDGVSVSNAYVDFDGSLVIELSNGNQIDAGFVSADNRDSIIQQIKSGALSLNELLPSQEGNSGKALLTNGMDTYWGTVSGGGGGAVDSVNGQTGTVVLDYTDVGAASSSQGALADTAIQPGDDATLNTLTVSGNLNVNGSFTTTNTETLQVQDPIIYVASGATGITSLDQGIVGHTVTSGTYNHMGLVRDHTDAKWKLFKGVTDEPTTVINWSQATYDTLKLGTLEATTVNVNGTSFTNTDVSNWNTAYGWGNHASAGYLTSATATATYQPLDADLTSWAAITPSTKQNTLVSGTSIKTINSTSLLDSGNLSLQETLVSGTNIKTVNNTSLIGSGNVSVQDTLVSGTNIKTINGSSILGSGDLAISGGSGSPGGSTGAVQYNNAGSFAGAANVDIDNGDLTLATNNSPVAPAAGNVKLFNKSQAGRLMPAFIGPNGLDSVLQPHLGKNGFALWKPSLGSTTVSNIGTAALTSTGTATLANYATTSLHTRSSRIDYLATTAATTAVAGYRATSNIYRVTDGFHHVFRVAPATGGTVSTRRFFCGMSTSTAAPTDVDPSTLTNSVGAGYGGSDANWQIYFGGTSVAKVDTGITKPSTDREGVFTVMIFAPPGGNYLGVRIVNEVSGVAFESSTTTSANIMAQTTAAGPRAYHSVGGTSSVVGLTLFSGYIETDN